MTDVAVDLGKTNCRAQVVGALGREARSAGSPGLAAVDGTTRAVAAVVDSLHRLGTPPATGWNTISVGAAGALAAPEATTSCADGLLREAGARCVVITSDAITAHVGAFAGEAGVAVIAGTGAVAIGVDPHGEVAVGDGSGPVHGDRGSGAWIGRAALQRATSGATALAARAEARYGPEWRDLASSGQAYELAYRRGEFVPDVIDLARQGDEPAQDVLRQAATELARTTRETIDRLRWPEQPVRVALLGGLTGVGDPFLGPFERALRPARVRPVDGTALDGAALLIRRLDLPHERHVTRRERA